MGLLSVKRNTPPSLRKKAIPIIPSWREASETPSAHDILSSLYTVYTVPSTSVSGPLPIAATVHGLVEVSRVSRALQEPWEVEKGPVAAHLGG